MLKKWQWSLTAFLLPGIVLGITDKQNSLALLSSKTHLEKSSLLLAQGTSLTVSDVKFVKDAVGTPRYSIEGKVTNSGTIPMRSLKVIYREYRQSNEELVEVSTNEATVSPNELLSGAIGLFGRVISEPPQVIFIVSIESPESGKIDINECYGDSLERREICRRQFQPSAVHPLIFPK